MLNHCDFFTAHKNKDGTYRIVGTVTVRQGDGKATDTILQVERAKMHIEVLDNEGEMCRIILPDELSEVRGETE